MFGVFLKETATDYQILVNVKPYRTDLRILSKEKYSKVSEIPVGVKVDQNRYENIQVSVKNNSAFLQ